MSTNSSTTTIITLREMFTSHPFRAGLQSPWTTADRPACCAWCELHPRSRWQLHVWESDSFQATLCLPTLKPHTHTDPDEPLAESEFKHDLSLLIFRSSPFSMTGVSLKRVAWSMLVFLKWVERKLWSVERVTGKCNRLAEWHTVHTLVTASHLVDTSSAAMCDSAAGPERH